MGRLVAWLRALVAELRRRKVFRAGAVYTVAAWIAMQVAAITVPALYLPDWVLTLVVVAAVAGLPVTLAAAWAFDVTPEGLRRTEEASAEDGRFTTATPLARGALFGLVVAISALAGWSAWSVWLHPAATTGEAGGEAGPGAPAFEPTRLAVLYFDNLSGDPELDAVARGLTEDLTHELAQVDALDVASRNGVKPYRGGDVPLDSVARDLRVGTVVEGSVDRAGDDLVVTAQLVDVSAGSHISSRRIQRSGEDLFALRRGMAEEVARHLRRRLGERIGLETERAASGSAEAWRTYYAAREWREQGEEADRADDEAAALRFYRRADSLLARSEEAAGDWVRPSVQRAWLALDVARVGHLSVRRWDPDRLRGGLAHAGRALERSAGEPTALEVRGVLRYRLSQSAATSADEARRLTGAAREDLEAAVSGRKGLARAWAVLSDIYRAGARFADARMAARRSRSADPYLHNDFRWLFQSAHLALEVEDFSTALRRVRRGRALYPDEPAYSALELLIAAGHAGPTTPTDSAWDLLREVAGVEAERHWPAGLLLVASVLARAGREDSARSVASRVRAAAPDDPMVRYYGANLHLLLGDRRAALEDLHAYLADRPSERSYVAHDWWWKPLREDSGFRDLVAERPAPSPAPPAGTGADAGS